jgi:hypothetical protein
MLGTGAQAQAAAAVDTAFYDGAVVSFVPTGAKNGADLVLGDEILGALSSNQRPQDHRPNLYVLAPGIQEHSPGAGASGRLSFNLILSSLPATEQAVEWDVYWAITLDPELHIPSTHPTYVPAARAEISSERELILAAQEGFVPAEHLEFGEIPGAAMLRECLHINSLAGLEQFRRPDGSLPRLIIVPSHLVVRASAAPQPPAIGDPPPVIGPQPEH